MGMACMGAVSVAGCRSEGGVDCGPGTREVDGQCVPEGCPDGAYAGDSGVCVEEGESQVACAPGTRLDGDRCVPDGTVLCGAGTMYDPADGSCVAVANPCPAGTTRIEGNCVEAENRPTPDVQETAEPNGLGETDTVVGVALGAVDETVTFAGCMHVRDVDGDGIKDDDFDSWLVTATEPSVLEVRVLGEGGMAGGFLVSGNSETLIRDQFLRAGISLVNAEVQRKLFLPAAGQYALSVADSRALAGFGLVEGQDACYWMEVTRRALPAPTALLDSVEAPLDGPAFYSATATAHQVLLPTVTTSDPLAIPALVALMDGEYVGSTARDELGNTALTFADVAAGKQLLLVVDALRDLSVVQASYSLRGGAQRVTPAAASVTLEHAEGKREWLSFSGEAGTILRVDLDGPAVGLPEDAPPGPGLAVEIFDGEARSLGVVCGTTPELPPCAGADAYVKVERSGTHYAAVQNLDAVDGDTYAIKTRFVSQVPTELAMGAPVEGSFSEALGARFYKLDASEAVWLLTAVRDQAGFLGDSQLRLFAADASGAGIFGSTIPAMAERTGINGVVAFYDHEGPELYLQVGHGTAAPETDATYTLESSELPSQDLGAIDPQTPVALGPVAISSAAPLRLIARGSEGQALTVSAVGEGVNPFILRFNAAYQIAQYAPNPPFPAPSATLKTTLAYGASPVALLEIKPNGAATGNVTVSISAQQAPYTLHTLTTPFTSVCPGQGGAGEAHPTQGDGTFFSAKDEGLSVAPLDVADLGLTLFGAPISTLTVSTNGWLTTQAAYAGNARRSPSGTPVPAGALSPFWADLDRVSVCTLKGEDSVVVEWRGTLKGVAAAPNLQAVMQARLFKTGRIELAFEDASLAAMVQGALFNPSANAAHPYVLTPALPEGEGHNTARFDVPAPVTP
jgi:hypothetical protein